VTDDLVKRLRDYTCDCFSGNSKHMTWQAADRIEALEAKNRLLEQSQAAHALAGLGVDVVAAYNSGLAALKAGCKEERLRAEKAETRIEALEAALTPSSDTKAAYHGEFSFLITVRVEDEETSEPIDVKRKVMVPWNTIKEIMAAIRDRAALGEKKDG
jgi:hypothetical protein